jgi:hypothetical protein
MYQFTQSAVRRQRGDRAQYIRNDSGLLDVAVIAYVALPTYERDHRVDLAKKLIGVVSEFRQVRSQRFAAALVHVLDQKLAIALDGVERGSQIVTQAAMERFGRLAPLRTRRLLDDAAYKRVQLNTCAAHPVEIGQQHIKPQSARVLDNDVEKFGNRRRWRLHLLAQEGGQSAAETVVGCGRRQSSPLAPAP